MACKTEIEKTIINSVDRYLPNRDAIYSTEAARQISKQLNALWEIKIAQPLQYSSLGGWKVGINNIQGAVEREYVIQKEAEKSFVRNIDFYGGDEALMNQEEGFLQLSSTMVSKASPATIRLIKDFLTRAEVEYEQVKDIIVNGKKLDAQGIANVTKALVSVAEGKEAQSLPEEAMHFAVELVERNNPELFRQMMKEINSYNILDTVFKNYGNHPLYQTKDGKPDILKIKKEAIGQVLAETVIRRNEGSTENPELLRRSFRWWEKIIAYIKNLIKKSGFNQAAIDIISGKDLGSAQALLESRDNIYLSNTRRDSIYNSVIEGAKTIKLEDHPTEKQDDGTPKQYYYIGGVDGIRINRRVSDLIYNWYDAKFRENKLTQSEFTKASNSLKGEKGTLGHKDFEHIFEVFIDEHGFIRETPLEDDEHIPLMGAADVEAYDILKENFNNRILSYGKNARFLKEVVIFDKQLDIAGTVDFIAIDEDGIINVLDWKFMDLNIERWDDVPWYKVNAWNQQMEHYKTILKKEHKIRNEEFGHTRMIPIKTFYTMGDSKTGKLPRLRSIEIGDVNVKNITDDYLLPVGIEGEETGNEIINVLLKKLNKIYSKMSDAKVLPDQRAEKNEQLNALYTAIRKLQIQNQVAPLINQAKILNLQVDRIIEKHNTVFLKDNADSFKKDGDKYKDAKIFTEDTISDFAKSLGDALEYIETYTGLDTYLESIIDITTKEGKELSEQLKITTYQARKHLLSLQEVDRKFTHHIIAKSADVRGASRPEKIIKGISKLFGTTGTLQLKSLQVLYNKANRAFGFSAMDTRTELNRLNTLKQAYTIWANSKGLSKGRFFTIIMKEKKNELIDEFKKEFYETLNKKKEEKDYSWISDNIDVKAYKEHLEIKLEEELVRIKSRPRIDTPERNDALEMHEISEAERKYTVDEDDSVGWLLDEIRLFPLKDKWQSTEWKELNKKENKPALDFYNYIRERNEFFASIGYINKFDARKFLPWVRKGLTEKLIFGGKLSVGEQFLRSITLDEKETEFGQIDPLTGKPVDTVPIMLTTKLVGTDNLEFSRDLFKTMGLYNEFAIKFNYIKQIEEQIRALGRMERNKEAIATSYFGKTKIENGSVTFIPDNTSNTKLLEDMTKAIIYQQRYLESEMFDTILGKIGKGLGNLNKVLGTKVFPENLEGRTFSVNKSITQLNNTYQMVVLGWNPLSSLSNLFGGKTQGFINSGRYFTKKDYVKIEQWFLVNRMGGSNKQLNLAAIEYFMPFTDNFNREAVNKLSISKLSQESFQDYLMFLMRNSDRAVQTTNFFAFLGQSVIIDNKIVNAREYIRALPEYSEEMGLTSIMYSGTEAERKARKAKFEVDVKKLVEDKAVMKFARVDEKGELVIPGIERKSDSVLDLRKKVQQFTNDSLGNATPENKRLINMTVYGNSVMVFKNWIPRLVDVRTGNLKYNAGSDAYEWGRSRMVFRFIYEDLHKSLGSLYNALVGNDKGIARVRKLFEDKRRDYELDTGKDLEMTETMFIDLVRQNIENQLYDTIFYATLWSLTAGLKALAPDDDESEAVKNQWRFIVRATDKLTDELGYFYNPINIYNLFSRGIFPSTNLISTYTKALGNFMKEMYGIIIEDEKLVEDTKVIKYWMKSFPILNQSAQFMGMFAPEVAKDLGLKVQGSYGFR